MNDPVDQQELRRAASHEAGHAVVAVRLAVPLDHVEVRIDGRAGFTLKVVETHPHFLSWLENK